jgi:spore coat protein JC
MRIPPKPLYAQSPRHFPDLFHFDPPAGTEELGHLEMVAALVHQLTRNLSESQIKDSSFAPYFVDHTTGVYPTAASGYPWTAASIQISGDTIADLSEDLAAEQKARKTYDNILRLSDDPDVNDVIKFLRQREIVHFQRFGEGLRLAKEKMNEKNVYYMNPSFDR